MYKIFIGVFTYSYIMKQYFNTMVFFFVSE